MNNIIKKVSAFAMAFTLLGTGTAITNIVSPQSNNAIVANAADNKIQSAVDWAINIANDDTHGYSQQNRNGTPDYDCSSLVITALKQAGINTGNASYTGNMKSEFTNNDFIWIKWNECKNDLIYGDVLFRSGHTELYIGNNKRVGAHSNYDGKKGDSSGREIRIDTLSKNENWQGVFRLKHPFIDVKPSDWFADAVQYVYNRDIMSGTSANTFSPNARITREQFTTVLFNMADDNEKRKVIYQNFFDDVSDGNWYTQPVMWAYCWGITSGYGRTFGVGDNITREQLIVMLYNYASKFKKINCSFSPYALDIFSDKNSVSSYAQDAMKWAVTNDIISGKATNSGTKLDPLCNTTRAECAQIIKNFVKKFGK